MQWSKASINFPVKHLNGGKNVILVTLTMAGLFMPDGLV